MSAIRQAFDDPRHRESEARGFEADQLVRTGDIDRARSEYAKAGELELEVARGIGADGSQPKLRSIFAISAVAYLLRGNQLEKAIRAAHAFLADPELLAADGVHELEVLLDDALRMRDVGAAIGTGADVVPLELRMEGGQVLRGVAPSRLVQEREEIVEAVVFRVADWVGKRKFRKRGRSAYARKFAFYEAPARAASYGIRFFITARQIEIPGFADVSPRQAVDAMLELATLAADEGPEALRARVDDPQYANAFLRAFRDLAPDGSAVESVSFSSASSMARGEPARFSARDRVALTKSLVGEGGEDQRIVTGILKVVSLRKGRTITVENDEGAAYRMKLLTGEHDDTIGPKLNRRVQVAARRKQNADGSVDLIAHDVVLVESAGDDAEVGA